MARCRKTPLTEDEARRYLTTALGEYATASSVALLMAHSAFETARWKAMYNDNFGNIGGNGDDGNFRLEDCGIETPPGNPLTFAAYSSPSAGAAAMVSLIKRLYPKAWDILVSGGSPSQYVIELKAGNWFTDSLEKYAIGVREYYIEYGGTVTTVPKVEDG